MPILPSISFANTHADNTLPLLIPAKDGSCSIIRNPANPTTGAEDVLIYEDNHTNLTMPVGVIAFFQGYRFYEINSSPSNGANTLLNMTIVGTGSPIAVSSSTMSPNGNGYTLDAANYLMHCTFMQTASLRYVLA